MVWCAAASYGAATSRSYVIPQRHFLKVAQAVRECRPSILRHFRNSLRGATGRLAWPAGSKSSKTNWKSVAYADMATFTETGWLCSKK
ncbi:hypothetical protein K1T71_005118 [Dendrolimus kikuchii]|uniref:Uncharacterized protein n=1 Tax=Dendrolimus kikuchii TaxID=765133 RepID=A0ACC1D6G4_9NEOP|nr:hypothetical protein K1T71_005118 [Dendrolimus kikuchii]